MLHRFCPCFYGLPKIYESGILLRPMVSFINSQTSVISSYLGRILSPVRNTDYTIKNSCKFADFTRDKILTLCVIWFVMLLNIGNDSRDRRSHSCTKNLPIVGAVVCKLRDFEAKRQQMNYILHGQRSSLSQGRVSFESLLCNFNDKVNGDFGEQQNNVKRCQFITSIKNFIPLAENENWKRPVQTQKT